MNPRYLFVAALTFVSICTAKDVNVTFRVVVPGMVAPLSDVYIASSYAPPSGLASAWYAHSPIWKMKETGPNRFELVFDFPESTAVDYRYTLGSLDFREIDPDGSNRPSRHFIATGGLVLEDTVALWKLESANEGGWSDEDVIFWYQRPFLFENYAEAARNVHSVAQLDSVIRAARDKWRQIADKEYGGAGREIFSGLYTTFMGVKEPSIQDDCKDFVAQAYVLPTWQGDFERLRKNPTKAKALLLVYINSVLQFAVGDFWLKVPASLSIEQELEDTYSKDEEYKIITTTRNGLPGVIETYIDSVHDEEAGAGLRKLEYDFAIAEPYYRVQDDINAGHSMAAYRKLISLLPQSDDSWYEYGMVRKALIAQLGQKGMSAQALDLLDKDTEKWAVHSSFTERQKDSLKAQYLRADAKRGEQRYEAILKRVGTSDRRWQPTARTMEPLSGTYKDLTSGKMVDLSALRGKTVVVDFWATWCNPCLTEIPYTNKFADKVVGREDVVFLTINCDRTSNANMPSEEYLRGLAKRMGIRYRVLLDDPDNSLAQRFKVEFVPNKFIVDKNGKIVLGPDMQLSFNKLEEALSIIE